MLLDIGVGILASIFLSHLFGAAVSPLFLSAGVLFSLLPDLDFLLTFNKNVTAKAHEHRDLLHYPLLFIPVGATILFFFDHRLAALFIVTTFLHFLHDSIGLGWGVPWLYPFSRNHYAFFYQYDIARNTLPQKKFYAWSETEVNRLASQYGDKHWIKNIYLKFHPYAVIEALIFILALFVLFFYR
jgi:LexA-binding, inner membrane-associated putative hydrolase